MSGQEIKSSLRKMEFPLCAQEALSKIGQLICGKVPSLKQMDLALDLMAEFVFCEVDKRSNKIPPLNPLKELQLLEVLFDYFTNSQVEAYRNTVFLSLFTGTTYALRSGVLSKLISVAIGTSSTSVLISASAWMQQLGNASANCSKLAEAIIRDYFILIPSVSQRLNAIPECAPQFVANFLTAVSEIYYTDNKGVMQYPPHTLLETVTKWIEGNYKLCIAAQQKQSILPPGAIAMETTTPIAGLLKWTVLAPLHKQDSPVYARLHLALLNSMLEIPVVVPPRAVCAKHLGVFVGYICRFAMELKKFSKKESSGYSDVFNLNYELMNNCIDRYVQAVQVALSTKCVYGNVPELLNLLATLPPHRLTGILVRTHQVNK